MTGGLTNHRFLILFAPFLEISESRKSDFKCIFFTFWLNGKTQST